MRDFLSHLPSETREMILGLAASVGLNKNEYNNTELEGFIQGAVSMYLRQQKIINALQVEIDLLEGEK